LPKNRKNHHFFARSIGAVLLNVRQGPEGALGADIYDILLLGHG
jgi:hypothetical protein